MSSLDQNTSRRVIFNIPAQAFVVYINEYDPENIGTGGVPLSERK